MVKFLAFASLLAGCLDGDRPDTDVTGPYTGPVARYVVDGVGGYPANSTAARVLGDDLDYDGSNDNQFGMVLGTLQSQGDVTTHPADVFAGGALASWLEIQADDTRNDGTVAVRYIGAEGDESVAVGGTLVDGTFASNRTRTTEVPGAAIVRLPIFPGADPSRIAVTELEIDLAPDGHGGYDAILRGGVADPFTPASAGLRQMIENDPSGHLTFLSLLDANRDRQITDDEVRGNSVLQSLMAPDVTIRGHHLLSFAVQLHLSPCASGSCAAPVASCFDRLADGDETDVDCGGSCGGCQAAQVCAIDTDCISQHCDAGSCRAPSCTDGVRDGYETDRDCGSDCGPCASGEACLVDGDCTSGECGAPCTDQWCVDIGLQTCQ